MSGALAPEAFEDALGAYLFERSEEARAVRVGEKETSETAAIVARHAHLFTREQLAALREAEVGGEPRRRARHAPAAGLRGRTRKSGARRPGGRARERPPRRAGALGGRGAAAALRDGTPRGRARLRGAVAARRARLCGVGAVQRRATRSAPGARGARGRALGRRGSRCAQRGGEGPRARPDPGRRRRRARGVDLGVPRTARPLVPAAARPRRRATTALGPPRMDPAPLAARGDVHQGARRARVRGDAPRDRIRPRRRARDPRRPRRPSAEVAARLRDRLGPAAGRPPHHPRDGRDPRLRGLPARGGPRPALRERRSWRSRSRSGASPAITRSRRSTRSCSTRSPASPAGTRSTSGSTSQRPRRTPRRRGSSSR